MASEQNCELVSEKNWVFFPEMVYSYSYAWLHFLQSVPKDIFTAYCFFPINLS